MIEPVRPIALEEIEAARERIAGTVLRTPLVRLDLGPAARTSGSSSKISSRPTPTRSAARPMRSRRLSEAERARGVWTVSAGNAGQGVAFAARAAGIPCTVVAIETAPQTKLERMAALGARIVPVSYEVAWRAVDGPCIRGHGRHASSIRSTITISSPATRRWGSRSSRTRPTSAR